MGGSSSSPVHTGRVERSQGGWFWLRRLWAALFICSRNEEAVEKSENKPLRSAILQKETEDEFKESSAPEVQHVHSTERLEELRRENQRLSSALEQKDKELQKTRKRLNDLSHENKQLRLVLDQSEEEHGQRMHQVEMSYKEKLRTAKKEKLNDFNESSAPEVQHVHSTERLEELRRENQRLSLNLEQKHKEFRDALRRMDHMEKTSREHLRSALEHKEAEHREKIHVLEKEHEERRRLAELKEKDLTERMNRLNLEKQQLRKSDVSSCQRCEHQAQDHRQQMCEMEKFYKDKLTEARSALKEKDEQFRSFKDRVAENMVLSSKTDNTENMNSPVNQSRLTEMYQQLRVCTWPNIQFPRSDREARTLVQEMFAAAAEHMKRPLETVEKVCGVKASSPKVENFRQTALENLQLALYHSSKQDVLQVVFPHFDGGAAELELASECCWLACLMALHLPPLHPHWDRADEGRGTVFPRDITADRRS